MNQLIVQFLISFLQGLNIEKIIILKKRLFKNKILCNKCKSIFTTYDPFLDISVPMEKCSTLYDCLDQFFEEEVIKD